MPKFGLALPIFETVVTLDAIARAAKLAEDGGWDSVRVTDHVLVAPDQMHPYGHLFEAMMILAYVAGRTSRVQLVPSVLVLTARNAVLADKEIATLDQLSNGCVILGIAPEWNEREFGFLNAEFHQRGKSLDEQVAVMRALWTQPSPAFNGRYYKFKDTIFSPNQCHLVSRSGLTETRMWASSARRVWGTAGT